MPRWVFGTLAALLLLARPLAAQPTGPENITIVDAGNCATAQACAVFSYGTNVTATVDISGTWTGTLSFEATVNGTTWRSLSVLQLDYTTVTSTTAGGSFILPNVGFGSVRVRATAAMTGTAVVYMRAGYVSARVRAPGVTIGSGAGVTVNRAGEPRELIYTVTISRTAFVCNATTCDVTIATLPATTFVVHALADLTQTFACTAVCTSATLSAVLGKTAGGTEYLLSWDMDAAQGQFGDAAAELGVSLAPATVPTVNGDLASWSAATAVVLRLTSGTGAVGNGTVTNLSQGSVTIYLTTKKFG